MPRTGDLFPGRGGASRKDQRRRGERGGGKPEDSGTRLPHRVIERGDAQRAARRFVIRAGFTSTGRST